MLRKQSKSNQQKDIVRLTERDAYSVFDFALATEKPNQDDIPRVERTKLVRYALNQAGVTPNFVHANPIRSNRIVNTVAELSYLPYHDNPISFRVKHDTPEQTLDQYHVAFGPNQAAIVTEIGEPGQPLVPVSNPSQKLADAQSTFNEIIDNRAEQAKSA